MASLWHCSCMRMRCRTCIAEDETGNSRLANNNRIKARRLRATARTNNQPSPKFAPASAHAHLQPAHALASARRRRLHGAVRQPLPFKHSNQPWFACTCTLPYLQPAHTLASARRRRLCGAVLLNDWDLAHVPLCVAAAPLRQPQRAAGGVRHVHAVRPQRATDLIAFFYMVGLPVPHAPVAACGVSTVAGGKGSSARTFVAICLKTTVDLRRRAWPTLVCGVGTCKPFAPTKHT